MVNDHSVMDIVFNTKFWELIISVKNIKNSPFLFLSPQEEIVKTEARENIKLRVTPKFTKLLRLSSNREYLPESK